MADLISAIKAQLAVFPDPEVLDLLVVVEKLQPFFPQLSPSQLGFEIAKVAVEQGCRYFIWDPPAPDSKPSRTAKN